MQNLPLYIPSVFIATAILTVWLLYKASGNTKAILVGCIIWMVVQAGLALNEFYLITDTIPPRFAMAVLPPLILISTSFATAKGKTFVDRLDVRWLTLLHIVRIPVELVLFWLYLQKFVPELMTFEGRNLDIVSGLSAPLIWYFGYIKQKLNRNLLLAWNFICIGLLLNIVFIAVLSAPTPFQQMAFDQPNIGVLYFPFIWLPAFVVPVVLFSHLASIRQLLRQKVVAKTSLTSKAKPAAEFL